MPQTIVIIGITSLICAFIGYFVARGKNRSVDVWGFACFIFPPLLIVLFFLPKNTEVKPAAELSEKDIRRIREDLWD